MQDIKMEATIIFESHLPDALRQALEYAGEDGFVASMPQLLHARANAPYDNEIWNYWSYTANSEENVTKTAQGNRVVVTVHGGGIFATPERFKKLYHSSVSRSGKLGFTGLFAAKIDQREARDVLEGRLPDGTEMPVFHYDEFKRGISNLPRRYAVIMDFEMAKNARNGNQAFDELKDDPLMIVRAGGVEAAATYLDKARMRNHATVMGSWHAFHEINADQSQARILFMAGNQNGGSALDSYELQQQARGVYEMIEDNDTGIWSTHYRTPIHVEYGLRGDSAMINPARYVAVAPRNVATGVRNVRFVA